MSRFRGRRRSFRHHGFRRRGRAGRRRGFRRVKSKRIRIGWRL